ncbi:MAG: SBBP repeat-containing protein, partial [Candidatus Schekmanbacteria bacterium]|nr:SBBP repeat-containing protein [Candidatus Schekmanbacteria bacterium]
MLSFLLGAVVSVAVVVVPTPGRAGMLESGSPPAKGELVRSRIGSTLGSLPIHFEPNMGQADSRVSFLARGSGYALFLTPEEAVLSVAGRAGAAPAEGTPLAVIRMSLVGAATDPAVTGLEQMRGTSSYFVGNVPARWSAGVPHFARVEYSQVYPGIDLVFHGQGEDGRLEYDFVVVPGGDPSVIGIRFAGAERVEIAESGDLVLHTPAGEIRQRRPVAYQQAGGERSEVSVRYDLGASEQGTLVALGVGEYDRERPLVIDPVLVFSTFLGGTDYDFANGIALDPAGNVIVVGTTASLDFPVKAPFTLDGDRYLSDTFVAKIDPSGPTLVSSTVLGGLGLDYGDSVAVDTAGSVFVAGRTYSDDFPTVGPLQGTLAGSNDAFLAKIDPLGTALVFSTYLGGTGPDGYDRSIHVIATASGGPVVVGTTGSTDFPLLNALQPAFGGGIDAFVARLAADGSALVFSTYLGGSGYDWAYGAGVDAAGNIFVAGDTESTDFPTRNPFQAANRGSSDGFVAKLDPDGAALTCSTYLGGTDGDSLTGLAVDGSGSVYLTGWTWSTDFPMAYPLDGSVVWGTKDAFVTKMNPAGSGLVYSTFLGGSGHDQGKAITVDPSGRVYVGGVTTSYDFPTASPLQASLNGVDDAFIAWLDPLGSKLELSTYLGGTTDGVSAEQVKAIAVASSGVVFVGGDTNSTDFPTANPLFGAAGGMDSFIAEVQPTIEGLGLIAVRPAAGGDTGFVTVRIIGSGFVDGAAVKLRATERPDIAAWRVAVLAQGSEISATFDLRGQALGVRDLVVTNPDGQTAT